MAMLGLFVGGPLAFQRHFILLGVGDRQSGLLVLFPIPEVVWEAFHRHLLHLKGLQAFAGPRGAPASHSS